MLGDTFTVTLGGSGGTARVCSKINQDSYGAEYLHRNTTDEVRVKVRHSVEKPTVSKPAYDRHNVEITQTVFPTEALPGGRFRQFYYIIRCEAGDDMTAVVDVAEAGAFWSTGANLDKIVGWES